MNGPAMTPTIQSALKRQYHASLAMLLEAIEACPDELWTSTAYANPTWQVAYHALFYTDFYLQPSEAAFVPWEHHRDRHQYFSASKDPATIPYSKAELIAYGRRCREMVDRAVDRLDLASPESGFPWYEMPKVEHQLLNLRHLHHHTGQIADRLRQVADRGLEWVGGPEL
jgi:hypothetical protein